MALPIIRRGHVPPGDEAMFLKVVCPPDFGANANPDPQPITRTFQRGIDVMIDLPLPPEVAARTKTGTDAIRLWIINDPNPDPRIDPRGGEVFPSPTIRTVEGDVCQAFVQFFQNQHTIHWHGIEGSTMNDGVGHSSFESKSQFPYQFATNTAGTFFYHCHKNAPLHVEMGLYGFFIVDPKNPNAADPVQPPYSWGGPGLAAANLDAFPQFPNYDGANKLVRYDVEALWAVDEFDSAWHELNHDAFMSRCDVQAPASPDVYVRGFLHDFQPDVFVITGIPSVPTSPVGVRPEQGAPITVPPVAVNAAVGQTALIRVLNAGYTIQEYVFGVDAVVISMDGYALGARPRSRYSRPFLIPAGTPFRLTDARRLELLIQAATPGTFPLEVRYFDWIRGPESPSPLLWHVARTQMVVV